MPVFVSENVTEMKRLTLKEAAESIGYKSIKSLKRLCARLGIGVFLDFGCKRQYVSKEEFEAIVNSQVITYIIRKYNCSVDEFIARMNVEVLLRNAIDDKQKINSSLKANLRTQRKFHPSRLDSASSRAMLALMEPLFIPPAKRIRGLGLCVFCYKCKTNVIDICHEKNVSLKKCPFGSSHVFKVYKYLPGTTQRRTLKLETRDPNEAIKQAIDFGEKTVSENNFVEPISTKNQASDNQQKSHAPLVADSIEEYITWLGGENVPEHLKRFRSAHHIGEVERKLRIFKKCLEKNGYDLSSLTMDELNDKIMGEFYQYLKEQERFGSNTFNKHLSYGTSWLKWFSNEHYSIRNWFAPVKRRKSNHTPLAIMEEEYNTLLKKIIPENGIGQYSNGKEIQYFRYWLADVIRLGLETGRRREEILKLQFSGIECDKNGRPEFIKVEDFKVNRSQNRFTEEEKKYIKIPVTDSLYQLLLDLNYEKYKGTDNYILAPEEKRQRTKAMKDTISRGFAHYIKQVTDRPLTFQCLRRTYITSLSLYLGGNAKAITGHSTDAVIEGHYLVKDEIRRKAKGLSVFGTVRNEELKEIRTNSKQQNREVEK